MAQLATRLATYLYYPGSNPGRSISKGVFHVSRRLNTFADRSAHLARLVHKGGHQNMSIILMTTLLRFNTYSFLLISDAPKHIYGAIIDHFDMLLSIL